ncbi:MAG TPA: Type 1 glutamine amidotransferase-like domain-containing protein [Thermoanaerobaculia bacterium]|jgi:hypothetical protein|nr:Type 1 glutamine amidotransferase-like domain-containing protein [Thermoanaerobaculia bacterium]
MATIKPVFLFSDSQLLFWRDGERQFLEQLRDLLIEDLEGDRRPFKAAYFGASNGDAPEFYELFLAAMDGIGIRDCRHVPARLGSDDLAFIDQADLLLFAGGDVRRGWDAFDANDLAAKIFARYYAGALLVGISAGAIQLGLKGWDETRDRLFDTFRVVPFVIDAHAEPDWPTLHRVVPRAGEHVKGIGIPTGGGLIYHTDYSLEPIRHPATEVYVDAEGSLVQTLLLPGEGPVETQAPPERPDYLREIEASVEGTPPFESIH